VPWALSQGQCSFSGREGIVSENDKNITDRSKILLLKVFGRQKKKDWLGE
jgi:hypothetical protein